MLYGYTTDGAGKRTGSARINATGRDEPKIGAIIDLGQGRRGRITDVGCAIEQSGSNWYYESFATHWIIFDFIE